MQKDLKDRISIMAQAITRLKKELLRSRQAAAALRRSEMRYRAIFDYTSLGLAQLATDGRFIEVNLPFCEIFGYTRAELLKKTYLDVTHPDDRELDRKLHMQLLSGERSSATLEKRYVRKDGAVVWANLNLSITKAGADGARYLLAATENINDRKTIQESLGRIATNLAKIEASSPSGVWRWNIKTGETVVSDEILQLFALPAGQSKMNIDQFLARVHPDDRLAVDQALQHAVSGRKPYQFEFRLRLPSGAERLVSAKGGIAEHDDNGMPQMLTGSIQDITLQEKTERALIDSERRFRLLFDNAADGIFIADQDGTYMDVNPSACGLLGYSREELVGKRFADLIPEHDCERLMRARDYLLQDSGHVQLDEWELKRSDGSYLPVEISARILPDHRWLAVVRDIGERKRAQSKIEEYAAQVQDLYDNAPCGYHSLDAEGIFVQVNKTELDWLGYRSDELIGKKRVTELLTAASRKKFSKNFPLFLETGQVSDLEFDFVRKDGSTLPVLLSACALRDENGKIVSSRTTLFDMTELADAQKKLRQAATVFDHASEAILITGGDGTIVAVNNAFTRITGYPPEEVIGKNPRLLKSDRQDDVFYRKLWGDLERHGTWQGEIWDKRKSGELFPAWESISAVKDDSGTVTDYISVFSDITTIKETEQRLLNLAYHDSLTGLPNRLLFNDRMNQALAHASRHRTRVALLIMDLDRFKLINDSLGHAAGDQLLQAVAGRLKDAVRKEDTVARLGGDEFAIILRSLESSGDAALFAQKLISLVSQPIPIDEQMLAISTSVGIAIYPDDAHDAGTLSRAADMAMYGAKESGRNAYEFYAVEMTIAANETLMIDHALRAAVGLNQLELLYQPQVNLSDGRIVGIEALVRWNRPFYGQLPPHRFIGIAEETNLIEAVGDWVLDTACAQMQKWHDAGVPPVRLAVNLSMRQLRKTRFLEDMRTKLLAWQPLGGFGIDLEVTETALQTEPHIIAALKELKSLGIKIVIDDFGTGYSSLNSLKHLPVDVLKIDRSFVQGIPEDADDRAIAAAIIAMGHSMDMQIIAEGIETQDQLQFMIEQHCDEAQGFLFFPPLPADQCAEFLKSNGNTDFRRFATTGSGTLREH